MNRTLKNYKLTKKYLKPESALDETEEFEVFISHSSLDKALVDAFTLLLHQGCGITENSLFYSSNSDAGVPPGKEITRTVRERLLKSSIAISIITPNFNRSSYCLAESGAIWVLDKKSLLLVCPPLSSKEVTAPTNQQRILNMTGPRDLDTARDILKSVVPCPAISTGRWCEARDIFIAKAGPLRQLYNASRERGISAIAAELPVPVAAIWKFLKNISARETVYAVLIDLDRLRNINEKHGFPMGSIILDQTNSMIDEFAREHKEVLLNSRCGDDTFFLVACGDWDGAKTLAEQVLKKINRIPSDIGRSEIFLTASAGVADFMNGESAKDWFERAYFACEQARQDGGNRAMLSESLARLNWSGGGEPRG
jgi:diguanylate cyclase (GGDEF)-like protein